MIDAASIAAWLSGLSVATVGAAVFKFGRILGRIEQSLSEHERRLNRLEGGD